MSASEAQKKAQKKWVEKNRDKFNKICYEWRDGNEEYRLKQLGYAKKYNDRKRLIKSEFKILCAIELI
jgi:hypothetical protein